MLLGELVRTLVDLAVGNFDGLTFGWINLDRTVVVAEGQHSFGLFAFRIRHLDTAKGRFAGESKVGDKDGYQKANGSYHDFESIAEVRVR